MISIRYRLCVFLGIVLMGFSPAPKVFTINTDLSAATWRWHSESEQHSGTVYISSGELLADNTILKSGGIRVDLNSLSVSTVRDLEHNARVTGWLKGREFFDTYNHPVAVLKIASIWHDPTAAGSNHYTLNGSLTIKNKTLPVRVPAVISFQKKRIEITTQLLVDHMNADNTSISTHHSFRLDLHLVAER